ncbi:unnamed protein product [Staurois parvus]|uniref:Olfactory receptor n=1 Tax=Staurois parvus TaxID=386267 RepID=A0ABN9H3X3_9NEOB|nr:unnamed protein product [Staurois parvus]
MEFLLLGFTNERDINVILFTFFLLVYILTLLGNITIISLTRTNVSLRTPMYFFLNNFAFLEIGYTTVTVPRMLSDLISGNMTISFNSCISQMYFFFFFGTTEFFILALMGFDRYLAICRPLHYNNIMNFQFCFQLVIGSWISGCMVPVVPTIVLSQKPFCGSKTIHHFFCDVGPLVKLSSADTVFLDTFVPYCFCCCGSWLPTSCYSVICSYHIHHFSNSFLIWPYQSLLYMYVPSFCCDNFLWHCDLYVCPSIL